MSTIKSILVPTDFSECAENALKTAADICKKTGATLHVLHVFNFSEYMQTMDTTLVNPKEFEVLYETLKTRAQEGFDAIKTNSHYQGINLVTLEETGNPVDVIKDLQDEQGIDLIVMGTKGTNNALEEVVGSVTEKIVRKAHCPVISVHEYTKEFAPKNLVYASDFSDDFSDQFQVVKLVAETFDATIHLVRLNTIGSFESTRYAKQAMTSFAHKTGLSNYTITQYDHEDFNLGLYYYTHEEIETDLICMGTHGKSGFMHFILGSSKAEEVVNHFKLPVLTFRI